jgi:hypothetical protein
MDSSQYHTIELSIDVKAEGLREDDDPLPPLRQTKQLLYLQIHAIEVW